MNYYEEKDLPQCPFWRKTEQPLRNIGCEGLTDHSWIIPHFDSVGAREQHEMIFCCDHYRKCELYQAVMEAKYAGEVDE